MDAGQALREATEHFQAGRLHQAEVLCRRLLQADPINAEGWHLLGMLGQRAGQYQAAAELVRRAIALAPHNAGFWNNLASIYHDADDFDQAGECLRQALRLRPDYAAAHNNLGEIHKAGGRLREALACYRAALAHQPGLAQARSNYLMTLNYDPDITLEFLLAEHRRWGEPPNAGPPLPGPFLNNPDPDRRLRLGYVSPDLRKHAVARFFEPVLRNHDRERFEVFLYAEVPGGDAVSERLQKMAAGWRRTVSRDAADVARQVRADGIDVLIDLAGHTRHNRLDVFVCKPAPVQVTYLGYPFLTGVPDIDYRLTDEVLDPPTGADPCPERPVRLPVSFACFEPPAAAPDVAPPPAIANGFVTFGSHHPLIKLNDAVLSLWGRVLEAVPGARLLFLRDQLTPAVTGPFLDRLERLGIPRGRVILRRPTDAEASYLPIFQEIDIVLDCVPFTGHTMTCEALWMGVPVLTLRGDRPAGRLSSSVLTALGLEDLIAGSPEDYVAKARDLAANAGRRAELRSGLRELMRTRLCDGAAFTPRLEEAIRQMWRDWCRSVGQVSNLPPEAPPRQAESLPRTPEGLNERGLALHRAGRPAEAAAQFQEALRLRPDYVPALNNLGNLLKGAGCLQEAEDLLVRATRLQPNEPDLCNNLGEVYRNEAKFPEALAAYRAGLEKATLFHPIWSNYLYALNFVPDIDADAVFEEHRRFGKLHAAKEPPPPHANVPDPERRLRVGYVSPYFHAHSGPLFFEPILRHHDRERFEVFLYGQVPNPDAVTARLQGLVAGWRATVGRTAAEVAAMIRSDGIDLLIDLAGHSGNGRLDVFALRPAPVQVNYLIYPNTTGLEAIDYRLTDAVLNPTDEPPRATERLYHLAGGYLCFQPPDGAPEVGPPPVLANGFVTFGSPHLPAKLNDRMLDLWRRVLEAVPGSRLAFGRSLFSPSETERLRRRLQAVGIDLDRVSIEQLRTGNGRHLEFAARIDIFLDSLPFSGKTTTCEYLWMGVPVVTMRGDRVAGRESAGILTTLGLPELIADNPEQYVALAARWAADVPGLVRLRQSLRQRVRERLGDGAAFTRKLEEAYRRMWRVWCASAGPAAESPQELNQRGLLLAKEDRFEEAAACFSKAIARQPDYGIAHLNLGMALRNQGRFEEAIAAYRDAMRISPDDPALHSNMGAAWQQLQQHAEAEVCYLAGARRAPAFNFAHHNYLVSLNYHPGRTGAEVFEEHRRWGRLAAEPIARTYSNDPDPERPLRVGYLSADFHSHPVSRFFEPILTHHDRGLFHVYLYGEVPVPDEVTQRLRARARGWFSTVGRDAATVAEKIRADEIDILVDLTGHYAGSRLDVLAQQPAPVQATYLGYPNTTGLPAVGWWLTDAVVNPPDEPPLATERIVYIPEGFSTFMAPFEAPEVAPAPALASGVLTFGSHHDLKKMTPAVFDLWARVLREVPGSRMLFLRSSHQPPVAAMLRRRFEERGIDPGRILVRQPPRGDVVYLDFYREMDVVLDTFPFGGHTMTCEALWMGVPVVTLRGDRPCGRLSASVLTSCGLPELIARTPDEYAAIARRLAEDVPGLARLRGELRSRMRQSLGNARAFTDRIEDVYRRMWREWCRTVGQVCNLPSGAGRQVDNLPHEMLHPGQEPPRPAGIDLAAALAAAREHFLARRFHDAEVIYRRILAGAGDCGPAWHGLGLLAWAAGHKEVAADCLRKAVVLSPREASFQADLERLLRGGPLFSAGAKRAERPAALIARAQGLRQQGKLEEAVAALREAAVLDPRKAEPHRLIGNILFDVGRAEEAAAAYRKAIELDPRDAATYNDLGNALRQMERTAEAIAAYREALRRDPKLFPAYANLGNFLAEEGRTEEAREHYARAYRLNKISRLRLLSETVLPILYESVEHVRRSRARLVAALDCLESEGLRVDPTQEQLPTHFYLAYQGENDRDIHAAFARFGQGPRRLDVRPAQQPPSKKLRVGFLSAYMRNHTIGSLNQGLIRHLSRDRFEVFVLSVGAPDAGLGRQIQQAADHYLVLPPGVGPSLQAAADLGLDILFHTDVGMNALTYTMGFSRLAPVQCCTWGHPVTTGLPTMDYFLSARHLDAEGAEEHYTEKLIRLPRLGVVYERPERPGPVDRASFGLPEGAHLYGCPQTLFKFHPEFDALLGDILRQDPAGLLVLIEGRCPYWNELLTARFRRTMPDVCDRVRFLPKQSRPDYLRLLSACDVMLDPIHFGGGNTSYESFAVGTPLVTLPSAFLRGRLTYAMYCQMGWQDLVAHDGADYVRLAVRLGTDPNFGAAMRRRIEETAGVLFGDVAVVRDLEQAFEQMHAERR